MSQLFRRKDPAVEAIQFVEVSRTQRKFGESVEYNDHEIMQMVNRPFRLKTLPEKGNPAGRSEIEIVTPSGVVHLALNEWLVRDGDRFVPFTDAVFRATFEVLE